MDAWRGIEFAEEFKKGLKSSPFSFILDLCTFLECRKSVSLGLVCLDVHCHRNTNIHNRNNQALGRYQSAHRAISLTGLLIPPLGFLDAAECRLSLLA